MRSIHVVLALTLNFVGFIYCQPFIHHIDIEKYKNSIIQLIKKNDANLYLMGDSTDRFFVTSLCSLICGYIEPLGNCNSPEHCQKRVWDPKSPFEERYRLASGACSCPAINDHSIGFIHHFGVAEDHFFRVYKDYVGADFGDISGPRISKAIDVFYKYISDHNIGNRDLSLDQNIYMLQSNMWDVSRNVEMKKVYKLPILPLDVFIEQYTRNLTELVLSVENKLDSLFISHKGGENRDSVSGTDSGLINSQYKMFIRTQHLPFGSAREHIVPKVPMTACNTQIKKIAATTNITLYDWENRFTALWRENSKVQQWDIVHQSVDMSFLLGDDILKSCFKE